MSRLRSLLGAPPLISAIGALMTIGALIACNAWHPPGSATLRAEGISDVVVAGSVTGTFASYARRLRAGGATGEVDVALPTPVSECQHLAQALGGACAGTSISLQTTLDAAWDAPVSIALDPAVSGSQAEVAAVPSDAGLQFTILGTPAPRLCLAQGLDGARLILGSRSTAMPAMGAVVPATCAGLLLRVISPVPSQASTFEVDSIAAESTSATLRGKQMTVKARDMTLTVAATGTDTVLRDPVTMQSDQAFAITTEGAPPDVAARDDVVVKNATNLESAGAERLPSALTRYPAVSYIASAVPLVILGLVAFLMSQAGSQPTRRRRRRP